MAEDSRFTAHLHRNPMLDVVDDEWMCETLADDDIEIPADADVGPIDADDARGLGLPPQKQDDNIAELGLATAASHAVTLSFETSLARLVARSWNDATRAGLSVDFLVAFACELAPRLDVHHRIRSAVLAEADVRKLSAPPFAPFVDQATLRAFQDEPRAK
ncbi:hypothetical protein KFE25_006739 [Diacronema lutheri]|uniref:Anaphase-promoting complex subunit 13 n=1 Tax=Diacronema lutheri TaxID=2081491 RepID=A0A8J5XSM8_DIALT|nr:hypothetical protein KFE25_006739 [Diacronema lutheri]